MRNLDEADRALLALVRGLAESGYQFVTITPASHGRVLERRQGEKARNERDVFGWSLPFAAGTLPREIEDRLREGGMLSRADAENASSSGVRVSTVRGRHYLHSAYPTVAEDAVFLGPDSYRFADLIDAELARLPARAGARVVDIGVGAGVGLLTANGCCAAASLVATDVNPQALRLAAINAAAAGATIDAIQTSGLEGVAGTFDLALLNPPYIIDADARAYRHGGGMHGGELSLELSSAAMERLSPGGRLILYTGSAIVDGNDALCAALTHAAERRECAMRYWEIDPDVFGEELSNPQYAEVDRIALVAAIFTKAG